MLISMIDYINAGIELEDPSPPREYVGASSIGDHCTRKIWYRYKNVNSTPISKRLALIFKTGKHFEDLVLDYLQIASDNLDGFELIRPSADNFYLKCQDDEVPEFQGHMDGMVVIADSLRVVVEIKSAKDAEFNKFKKLGLQTWKPAYFAQLHSYMGMEKVDNGVEIVINKDSQEIAEEWHTTDRIYYEELRERARRITIATEPPERINPNPIYYLCQQCEFKRTCHGLG